MSSHIRVQCSDKSKKSGVTPSETVQGIVRQDKAPLIRKKGGMKKRGQETLRIGEIGEEKTCSHSMKKVNFDSSILGE